MKPLFKALFIIPLIVFPAINYCQKTMQNHNLQVKHLTESDSGKTLTISKGQIFTLTLPNRVAGGYRFDKAQYDTSVLRLDKYIERLPAANSALGSHGWGTWQFTVLRKATTTLKITASRPWHGGGTITEFSSIVMVK
jgi:predicted secreted protein